MEDVPEPPINPNFDDFDDYELDQTSDLHDDGDDEDQTSDLHADDERKIKNFMKDLPSRVSFRRPKSKYHLWSFWSEPTLSLRSGSSITDSATHTPTTNQPIITDIIKSALLHFNDSFLMVEVLLIQFWAPMTTETGCVQLVTSDQPFALSYHLDEGLLEYRKQCLQYKFNVDGDGEGVEGLGIAGRVFRQKWPELIQDVGHYSTKEYPQRDFALACHILSCCSFPVFQTSFQECVGVLEFATTTDSFLHTASYLFMKHALKSAGLKTSWCDALICKILYKDDHPNIWAEIEEGLEVVCKTHDLPLAKTWIRCRHFNGLAFDGNLDNSCDTFDVSCMGPAFHCDFLTFNLLDHNMKVFFYHWSDFQNRQEVVRSAYQSHKLCLCRDLTQFSITEYPSLPLARAFGLRGCFAIYLQNTRAKNFHYVLEFFSES
ncbi:protein NLP6-like isoform X1 [Cornus florida]|uniref:protein NLP6-like isoform X1 n=1 Tax=Cornus florida TaxID=4283 RepID=UPI0028A180D2|nr:protein NLP6-like isoform X1 [Cornus florida]